MPARSDVSRISLAEDRDLARVIKAQNAEAMQDLEGLAHWLAINSIRTNTFREAIGSPDTPLMFAAVRKRSFMPSRERKVAPKLFGRVVQSRSATRAIPQPLRGRAVRSFCGSAHEIVVSCQRLRLRQREQSPWEDFLDCRRSVDALHRLRSRGHLREPAPRRVQWQCLSYLVPRRSTESKSPRYALALFV
jgi:hypothetical protein